MTGSVSESIIMKQVLITGASRGIGRATAEEFLAHSWSVIGTSTSGKTAVNHPGLTMLRLDFLRPESVHEFSSKIIVEGGHFDVLVNNAGVSLDEGPKISIDALRRSLEVNLIGLVDLTERLIPMIASGGHIINVSSGLSSITVNSMPTYAPAYSISKAAVNMYTRILAERLRGKGITVSSIDPGWVKTDMGGPAAPRHPSEPAREIYELAVSGRETGQFWHNSVKRPW